MPIDKLNMKPLTETILDWFERNPTSAIRSAQLAKVLKITPDRIADGLWRLADQGKLVKCKVIVGDSERTRGSPKTQFEYKLPAGAFALPEVKPLKIAKPYRRPEGVITQAGSGVVTPAVSEPETLVEGSTHDADSAPAAEIVVTTEPPKPDDSPAAAGSDVIPEPDYHPDEVGFDPEKRALAIAVRNYNLITDICVAIDFPDSASWTDLPDHIAQIKKERDDLKFMLAYVEQHLEVQPGEGIIPALDRLKSNFESVCSATRKHCAWVAAECLEDVFPLNLFQCQQAIYDAFSRRDARIAELEGNASLPLENAPETPSTAVVNESLTTQLLASDLLQRAAQHMADRAATYDKPGGERSMLNTVSVFNIITGNNLSEADGWLMQQILKDVRQWQRPTYHADSAEDCIAYAALKAEALLKMAVANQESA